MRIVLPKFFLTPKLVPCLIDSLIANFAASHPASLPATDVPPVQGIKKADAQFKGSDNNSWVASIPNWAFSLKLPVSAL